MAINTTPKAPRTRAQKDAARDNKKAAAVVATRDAAVGTLINKAGQAAQSMYSLSREAAIAASKQLNPAKPLQERIAEVMSLYVADFTAAGHNVKAIFGDVLTLQACAQTPVVVSVPGEKGKAVDASMTAGEAVNASKHAMRDAAKQVREAMGIGRKAGAGRKPATPPAAPPEHSGNTAGQNAATVSAASVDAFSAWLNDLDGYVTDQIYNARITARLIELGFVLSKAAKGRKVIGEASM